MMTAEDSTPSILWEHRQIESPVDKVNLRYSIWKNSSKQPEFGILLVSGRGEWVEKYSHLPPKLSITSPILWLIVDHRGQGQSGGKRAHVDSYDDFSRDLGFIAEHVFKDLPFVVLAHSMGGLISLSSCISGNLRPKAMLLCAPLLRLPASGMPRPIAKLISFTLQKTPFSALSTGAGSKKNRAFPLNTVTHSYSGFKRYRRSPFPQKTPSFGWVASTIKATDLVFRKEAIEFLSCPVCIMYGSEEFIVDPTAYPQWCLLARKYTKFKIDLVKIQGARHELLNEIPRIESQVLTYINHWVKKHTEASNIP